MIKWTFAAFIGLDGSDMLSSGRQSLKLFGDRVVTFVEVETERPFFDELVDGLVDGRAAHQDAQVRHFGQFDADLIVAPVDQVPVAAEGRLFAQMSVFRTVQPNHLHFHVLRLQVFTFLEN